MVWSWQSNPGNAGCSLNKYSLIGLLYQATENCLSKPSVISNGFKRAGIQPWDKMAPDTTKLLPGTVFENSTSTEDPSSSPVDSSSPSSAHPSTCPGGSSSSTPSSHVPTVIQHQSEMGVSSPIESVPDIPPATSVSPEELNTSFNIPALLNSSVVASKEGSSSSVAENANTSKSLDHSLNDAFIEEPHVEQVDVLPAVSLSLPYWTGLTAECGHCHKRILKKFHDIHLSSCFQTTPADLSTSPPSHGGSSSPWPPGGSSSTTPLIDSITPVLSSTTETMSQEVQPNNSTPSFKSLPAISLEDRKLHLTKFEVLLLTPAQVEEFNIKYSSGLLDSNEPLYQAWLQLKLATQPTESEAILQVLGSHTATNVPKRVRKRNAMVPDGPPRYDPSSPQWVKILEDRENKKVKLPDSKAKSKAPKPKAKQKISTKKNVKKNKDTIRV